MSFPLASARALQRPLVGYVASWSHPSLDILQLRIMQGSFGPSCATLMDHALGKMVVQLPHDPAVCRFTNQYTFAVTEPLACLRVIQVLYVGAHSVTVADNTFGAVAPGEEHVWRITWANPFTGDGTVVDSDVFFFDGDMLLAHQRMEYSVGVDDPSAALLEAIEDGLTISVAAAIHRGALKTPEIAAAALHLAVQKRFFSIITVLLDHDVSLHALDANDKPVLYAAVEAGDKAMIKFLMDRGANRLNDTAQRSLLLAISHGAQDVVEMLIENGTSECLNAVYRWNDSDWTPLLFAYYCNQPGIALQLLLAGASAVSEDWAPSTLYYCIRYVRDTEACLMHVVQLIEMGAAVDIHKTFDKRAQMLGRHRCDTDSWGRASAMTAAIKRLLYEVVLVLVAHQANSTAITTSAYDAYVYELARDCDDGGHMLAALGLPAVSYAPAAADKTEPIQRVDTYALDNSILDTLIQAPPETPVTAMQELKIEDGSPAKRQRVGSDDWELIGCRSCENYSQAMEKTLGKTMAQLPRDSGMCRFTNQYTFVATKPLTSLRLIQVLYVSELAVIVADNIFGAVVPGEEHTWSIAWGNPFTEDVSVVDSDVFFFDGDVILAHHRIEYSVGVDDPSAALFHAIENGLTISAAPAIHCGALKTPEIAAAALHLAVQKRFFSIITLPLLLAYYCKQPGIAMHLLSAGASAVREEWTPSVLYYCITYVQDADACLIHVLQLIEMGAAVDIHKFTDDNESAMTAAIKRLFYEVVLVLVAHQANSTAITTSAYDAYVYELARDCDDGGHMLAALGLPAVSYAPAAAAKTEPIQRVDTYALDNSILDTLIQAPPETPELKIEGGSPAKRQRVGSDDWELVDTF
ncbi:hypothetical protein ACHHYP_01119 [Achlya hypogyna]|uniref:Uncharacterized protein n=1 Tax=Achlya hypogyna TaxID=1202772 RepID=A0A1V9Z9P2_ACHHY|nr:hypothetical protein ACHHYP_01119 [Achlya hypogyna]